MKLSPLFLTLAISASAHAVDLGVQGTAYPIVEQDIRIMMMESAHRANWDEAQNALKESAKNYTQSLPKRQFTSTDKTYIAWQDPSVELTEDVQAPVQQPDGSYQWGILFPKGTRVNPLDTLRPSEALVFFNGNDENQLNYVKKLSSGNPLRFTLIEAGEGDIGKTNKFIGRGVFHAPDALLQKFGVQYLPAIVYAGEGPHAKEMATLFLAAPYKVEETIAILPKYLNLTAKPADKSNPAKGGKVKPSKKP